MPARRQTNRKLLGKGLEAAVISGDAAGAENRDVKFLAELAGFGNLNLSRPWSEPKGAPSSEVYPWAVCSPER